MHEKLNILDLTDLARSLLICWAGFENVRQNVIHMAFRSNVMYFADESTQVVNEDELVAFYRTHNALKEPEMLARHALDAHPDAVRLASLMYERRLDETEQAALMMLFLLRTATKQFDVRSAATEYYDQIFRSLHSHCQQTYSDDCLRMASVVLMLDELEKATNRWEEHNVLLSLNGQEPVADLLQSSASKPIEILSAMTSRKATKYYLGTVSLEACDGR
ncbi:hypothetical protein AAVH_24124 [Aphelenchoides avenae]|nr:hypothetical protein AAVH_24124 [Aphelenchus avenae]